METHQQQFAAIGRVVAARIIAANMPRISLAFSASSVVQDCQRITAALQAQQRQAANVQQLLSRPLAFHALNQIDRTTQLCQCQLGSIVRASSSHSLTNATKDMDLTFSVHALAKYFRRITDGRRLIQAHKNTANHALSASLDFRPTERMGTSFLRGLRQSLAAAAAALAPSMTGAKDTSRATNNENAASVSLPHALAGVAEESQTERKARIFLAKLPTYFALAEDPPLKRRMH